MNPRLPDICVGHPNATGAVLPESKHCALCTGAPSGNSPCTRIPAGPWTQNLWMYVFGLNFLRFHNVSRQPDAAVSALANIWAVHCWKMCARSSIAPARDRNDPKALTLRTQKSITICFRIQKFPGQPNATVSQPVNISTAWYSPFWVKGFGVKGFRRLPNP